MAHPPKTTRHRTPNAKCSSPATAAASRVEPTPTYATCTTSDPSPKADPPNSTTSYWPAGNTTPPSTTLAGKSTAHPATAPSTPQTTSTTAPPTPPTSPHPTPEPGQHPRRSQPQPTAPDTTPKAATASQPMPARRPDPAPQPPEQPYTPTNRHHRSPTTAITTQPMPASRHPNPAPQQPEQPYTPTNRHHSSPPTSATMCGGRAASSVGGVGQRRAVRRFGRWESGPRTALGERCWDLQ